MDLSQVRKLYTDVLENIGKVIVGQEEVFTLMFTAVLSRGHVLLEDTPGTGKTSLAKAFAKSVSGTFHRVQFTPDLLPQDITGLSIYNQKTQEFQLMKGPVFTNLLLADEINRATPRTQSALLEAMEERHVTIDTETLPLEKPFLVIATENPVETTGTYPLPEAQLDRFLMKLSMKPLEQEQEAAMLDRFQAKNPMEELQPVTTVQVLEEAAEAVSEVKVHPEVRDYILSIVGATRHTSRLLLGASPRASLALQRAAMAFAAVSGRNYVTPDDVRYLAPYVLAHRVMPGAGTADPKTLIREMAGRETVPVEDWTK
ncbi:MAG: MoxR family ATPase [Eubacterium sp.]|nr:MoxR family ATPase [Eubacterium sp.]